MKLAPTWHWRAKYSLGRSGSPRITSAPKICSWLTGCPGAGSAAGRHAPVVVVERGELLGQPGGALLGEHHLQAGMAFEHAGEDQVPEGAVRPPGDLEQEHHLGLGVGAVVGRGAAAVVGDRHAELLAHRPQWLVVGGVQRRDAGPGRCAGQQHAAGQPRLVRPAHLGHRPVDVVQHDLGDAGPAAGGRGAEVGQPAVVGVQAGPAQLEVAGGGPRRLLRPATARGRTAAPCWGRSPPRRRRRPRARQGGGRGPSCGAAPGRRRSVYGLAKSARQASNSSSRARSR